MNEVIVASNLGKTYKGGIEALKGLGLTTYRDEIFCRVRIVPELKVDAREELRLKKSLCDITLLGTESGDGRLADRRCYEGVAQPGVDTHEVVHARGDRLLCP